MSQPRKPEATARLGAPRVARTAAIALGCISTALCILTVAAFSRARRPERERLPPEAEKFIARSLDGMAEGVELWRRYRQGKMTDKEFDRRRHKLRDSARGGIGFSFSVLQRERRKGGAREGGVKEGGADEKGAG